MDRKKKNNQNNAPNNVDNNNTQSYGYDFSNDQKPKIPNNNPNQQQFNQEQILKQQQMAHEQAQREQYLKQQEVIKQKQQELLLKQQQQMAHEQARREKYLKQQEVIKQKQQELLLKQQKQNNVAVEKDKPELKVQKASIVGKKSDDSTIKNNLPFDNENNIKIVFDSSVIEKEVNSPASKKNKFKKNINFDGQIEYYESHRLRNWSIFFVSIFFIGWLIYFLVTTDFTTLIPKFLSVDDLITAFNEEGNIIQLHCDEDHDVPEDNKLALEDWTAEFIDEIYEEHFGREVEVQAGIDFLVSGDFSKSLVDNDNNIMIKYVSFTTVASSDYFSEDYTFDAPIIIWPKVTIAPYKGESYFYQYVLLDEDAGIEATGRSTFVATGENLQIDLSKNLNLSTKDDLLDLVLSHFTKMLIGFDKTDDEIISEAKDNATVKNGINSLEPDADFDFDKPNSTWGSARIILNDDDIWENTNDNNNFIDVRFVNGADPRSKEDDFVKVEADNFYNDIKVDIGGEDNPTNVIPYGEIPSGDADENRKNFSNWLNEKAKEHIKVNDFEYNVDYVLMGDFALGGQRTITVVPLAESPYFSTFNSFDFEVDFHN